MSLSPRVLGGVVALAAFLLDQAVKQIFLYGMGYIHLPVGDGRTVTPFLNFVMVWNEGVSFGLFPAASVLGRYLLAGFSLVIVVILSRWLWRTTARLVAVGIGLVIGGALGNVLDRLIYAAVADFFDFHAFGYHWYVFNVADAAIVCGVGLLMYEFIFGAGEHRSGTN